MPNYSKDFIAQCKRSMKTYAAIIEKISKQNITEFSSREQLHIMTACHDSMKHLMTILESEGEDE